MVEKRLLDQLTDGWWYFNIQTGHKYLSPKLKATLGYKPEELSNSTPWSDLIHPEDIAAVVDEIKEGAEYDGSFQIDARYFHKDGGVVWILCRGTVTQRNEQGDPVCLVGTHTDITHLKKAEQAIKHSLQEIDEMAPYGGSLEEVVGIDKLSLILDRQILKLKQQMGDA